MNKRSLAFLLALCLLCGCTVKRESSAPLSPEVTDAPPAMPTLTPDPTLGPAPESSPEPTPVPTPEPTPEPPAVGLPFQLGYYSYSSEFPLSDNIISTISSYSPAVISAEEPFSRLYLRWYVPPAEWTLEGEGFTLTCGQNGFLHELVTLPKPCTSVILRNEGNYLPLQLIGSAVFTDGALPDWVQDWQPPLKKADLMILSTHNDDDILYFGAAEPYYAKELGYGVQVVYFTDQIERHPRMNDCLNALWYMGIRNYPVFGRFYDFKAIDLESYYQVIPVEEAKAYLVENIRRFRPEVLVTQDVNGEYGHMEHVFMLELFREIIEKTADENVFPESAETYGVWDVPKTYIHLWGEETEQTVMDWDAPLSAFGGLSGIEVARNAYMLHVSEYAKALHLVEGRDDPYSSYRFGLYRSTVGEDHDKNDLFENIKGY